MRARPRAALWAVALSTGLAAAPRLHAESAPAAAAIVVRAERLDASAREAAYATVTLDAERLQTAGRLDDALRQSPGFSLFRRAGSLSANPTIQGASLRGLGPNGAGRALVTLDGAPQNDPFGGWVYWSRLDPLFLDGATITRGGGAGPFGPQALTGVVALGEARPAPGEVALRAEAGNLGWRGAAAIAGLGAGAGRLTLFGAAGAFDGWIPQEPARRGAIDRPAGLEGWSAGAAAAVPAGAGALAARLAAFEERRGAGLAGADSRARGADLSVALRGPLLGADARAGLSVQVRDLANRTVAPEPGRAAAAPALAQDATPSRGAAFSVAARWTGPGWEAEAGGDARLNAGETRERFRAVAGAFTRDRRAGGRQSTLGAYAEGLVRRGRWTLTGGARLDRWDATDAVREERDRATGAATLEERPPDRSGVIATARIGGVFQASGRAALRAAAYSGFRPPTLNELHRPFRVGADVTEADAALRPERLSGAEAGVRLTGPWRAEATAFVIRLDDPVANVTLGTGPGVFARAGFLPAGGAYRQRRNVGAITARGVEASAGRDLGRLTVEGALALVAAEVDGGRELPALTGLRPAQTARAQGAVWAAWRGDGWRLDLAARGESARFEDDLNQRRLAGFLTLDARAAVTIAPGAEAFVAGENLFDAPVATGRAADGAATLAAPRLVRAGVLIRR